MRMLEMLRLTLTLPQCQTLHNPIPNKPSKCPCPCCKNSTMGMILLHHFIDSIQPLHCTRFQNEEPMDL